MKLASKGPHRKFRMKLRGQLGIALALTAVALGADAAGLGRLTLMSGLGQPLRAEIDLTSVARDETGTLTAKLAGADAFSQANIEYGSALSGLRFSIQRRANGQPYVLVTSNQIVNEPYIDMLVELTWGSGRLVREYTMLLDPPELRAARIAADAGPVVQALPSNSSSAPPSSSSTSRTTSRSASAPSTAASDTEGAVSRPRRSAPRTAPDSRERAGGDYRVQPGDTAISIARNNKPADVSLEQMLAALYRGNPKAFGGNINLLLAGATLRIPDAAAAQAVDRGDAHRIIVAQSSNFGTYRDRVARNAAEAPTARSAGPQASGKLTTRVDDAAAPGAVKDRLELSRVDAGKAGGSSLGAPPASAARGTLNAPASDEIAAKERELQETKARLALLEKNVADLQKLLQLKNQTLADLQKGNDVKTADAGTSSAAPPAAVAPPAPSNASSAAAPAAATPAPSSPAPSPSPSTASTDVSSSATPPAAVTTPTPSAATPPAGGPAPAATTAASNKTAKSAPAVAPAAEPSLFEQLMDNTMLVIGIAILLALLIVYGIYTMARRRKLARFEDSIFVDNSVLRSNSLFGTTGGQSVDTANTGFHSNFVPVAGNLPEQNEVDPVAEADVYIAYGRDAQAEEILKEALRADPTRHAVRLKLLEIYAKRGDSKTFETMASELYAATGGQGDEWKQAAALGASIDPNNPLYRDMPSAIIAPSTAASPSHPTSTLSPAFGSASSSAHGVSSLGTGLGAAALGTAAANLSASSLNMRNPTVADEPATNGADELARTDPLPRLEPEPVRNAGSAMDLDFNLGLTDIGPAPLEADEVSAKSEAAPAPGPRSGGLDFDVGESGKTMIEPFTASAFGVSDPTARTAVNLPAFRARAEQEPEPGRRAESDSFTASDIFGSSISSISAESQPMDDFSAEATRPSDTRIHGQPHALDSQQFEKTEPINAFSKINLDLDTGYQSTEVRSDDPARTDVWQAMATKLDLAMAYRDIGDTDGAREILEEVVRSGDHVQADRARQLIGELG